MGISERNDDDDRMGDMICVSHAVLLTGFLHVAFDACDLQVGLHRGCLLPSLWMREVFAVCVALRAHGAVWCRAALGLLCAE